MVVLGSVSCFLYYTIRFNVRRTDALNQTQEIADELYPMIVERDFDASKVPDALISFTFST